MFWFDSAMLTTPPVGLQGPPPELPDGQLPDRRQQLRVFFSADLVNGTAFKSRRATERFPPSGPLPPWPVRFEEFFHDFRFGFEQHVREARRENLEARSIVAEPVLWKLNGDEVLFNELAYPDDRELYPGLATAVAEFVKLVVKFDADLLPEGMGLRGCVWTAGFPIRNRRVQVQQGPDIRVIASESRDHETGEYLFPPAAVTDYIGRDMDLGFRIAATTPPGRVSCSLDVAERLTAARAASSADYEPVHVFRVGWRILKGIGDGHPYPLFWLDTNAVPRKRRPWDDAAEHSTDETRFVLESPGQALCSEAEVLGLAETLRRQLPDHYIKAYASTAEMIQDHERTWREGLPADHTALGPAPVTSAVPPETVPTITLDDLNQVQILLQTEPARVEALRDVLTQIAAHPAYREWEAVSQYASSLFVIPSELTFGGDERRRLLEALGLAVDDVLRIKINVTAGQVFVTDGLWVHQDFRTFPFVDESDLLHARCAELDWDRWATCVLDPATGAGHNALRYPHPQARRYGFDINARALSYASINAALNGVGGSTFGINDIREGLPPVFGQSTAERVLVLANMPIGLSPFEGTLPRSAEGGRYGYERTMEALRAVHELEGLLDGESRLRALILSYSVGNRQDGRWAVPEYAADLFGAERVTWHLNEEEMLWRVNGRKEESNPMPLERLERKAECKFHVRRDADRPEIKRGYAKLTAELHDLGFDHLAYGIVVIDCADDRAGSY
jgi:hypothetical protein